MRAGSASLAASIAAIVALKRSVTARTPASTRAARLAGPLGREVLHHHRQFLERRGVGIEILRPPFLDLLMPLVIRIGHRGEAFLIAGPTADILGRAMPRRLDQLG